LLVVFWRFLITNTIALLKQQMNGSAQKTFGGRRFQVPTLYMPAAGWRAGFAIGLVAAKLPPMLNSLAARSIHLIWAALHSNGSGLPSWPAQVAGLYPSARLRRTVQEALVGSFRSAKQTPGRGGAAAPGCVNSHARRCSRCATPSGENRLAVTQSRSARGAVHRHLSTAPRWGLHGRLSKIPGDVNWLWNIPTGLK
jgi:hypothetical protein